MGKGLELINSAWGVGWLFSCHFMLLLLLRLVFLVGFQN